METAREHEQPGADESIGGALARNPVVHTLVAMAAVSVLTWTGKHAGNIEPFVLQAPITDPWWSLVVSNYAHLNPSHLVSNAILLALAGGLVSLSTSAIRFHVFFLVTGALSSAVHVWVTGVLGTASGVLGASGATFALAGYLITGNPVSSKLLGRSSGIVVALLTLGVALALTVMWSGPGSAYISHFAGVSLGLTAGRFRLLNITGQ